MDSLPLLALIVDVVVFDVCVVEGAVTLLLAMPSFDAGTDGEGDNFAARVVFFWVGVEGDSTDSDAADAET
jgi:hypothetical protein